METEATMNWLELPLSTVRPWLDVGLQIALAQPIRIDGCRVREALVAYAEYLPRLRSSVEKITDAAGSPQRPFSGVSQ